MVLKLLEFKLLEKVLNNQLQQMIQQEGQALNRRIEAELCKVNK
jgi:hypothetical protein